MNTPAITAPTTKRSPAFIAKIAGVFYLLTFVFGGIALTVGGKVAAIAGPIAGIPYIAVTVLFYYIFKPVNRNVSFLAAFISLFGCVVGPLDLFLPAAYRINPLVVFGFYCLLIGYLILRSTFLPRFLGILMVLAGLGWLTFVSPQLAKSLSPFNFLPGIVGEGALTVWLLAKGVDAKRWKAQAGVQTAS